MSYAGGPARLSRRDGAGEIVLDGDLISIGRSPKNAIVIPDTRVSRRHAQIRREGASYWLEDLGGANGTFVNGQRAPARVQLQHGDNIAIGEAQFYFIAPAVPNVAPAPQPVPPAPPAPPPPVFAPPPSLFAPPPPPAWAPPPAPLPPAPAPAAEPSLTSLIRQLDEPPADLRPAAATPAPAPPPAPQGGQLTRMIAALDAPDRPPERVLLRAIAGPAQNTTYEVRKAGGRLGRATDNTVAIPDDQLSRHHAQIQFGNDAFWLVDTGSHNGTFVNGAQLTAPCQLRSGDQIALGATQLLVTLDP